MILCIQICLSILQDFFSDLSNSSFPLSFLTITHLMLSLNLCLCRVGLGTGLEALLAFHSLGFLFLLPEGSTTSCT